MLHPDTELRWVDDVVGVGVFATRSLPRGTITWILDPLDVLLTDHRVASLSSDQRAVLDRYAWLQDGEWVLCWDHGRFVNHACDANCLGLDWRYEIAVRDIAAGEQLTDDYGTLGPRQQPFPCHCGSPSCTGWFRPDRAITHRALWMERVSAALPDLPRVPQPLARWLQADWAGASTVPGVAEAATARAVSS